MGQRQSGREEVFKMSNAFKRSPGKLTKGIVPVYDHYKSMFNACDRFNRMLHDRKWPHKNGGRDIPRDVGHHHNFAMSCILQNTFNAYIEKNGIIPVEYEFKNTARCYLINFSNMLIS